MFVGFFKREHLALGKGKNNKHKYQSKKLVNIHYSFHDSFHHINNSIEMYKREMKEKNKLLI